MVYSIDFELENTMITQWFKKALSLLGDQPIIEEVLIDEQSVREQGRLLHLGLKEYLNQSFKVDVGGLIQFECIRPNIISLTELVIELNNTLKDGTIINPSRCDFTEKTVTISTFFEKDGRYISHSNIFNYCKVAEDFYKLTEVCEKATVGIHEHNNRMLARVFSSLKNVNAGLLEVFTYKD